MSTTAVPIEAKDLVVDPADRAPFTTLANAMKPSVPAPDTVLWGEPLTRTDVYNLIAPKP